MTIRFLVVIVRSL